jgi:hypothetical protein
VFYSSVYFTINAALLDAVGAVESDTNKLKDSKEHEVIGHPKLRKT